MCRWSGGIETVRPLEKPGECGTAKLGDLSVVRRWKLEQMRQKGW